MAWVLFIAAPLRASDRSRLRCAAAKASGRPVTLCQRAKGARSTPAARRVSPLAASVDCAASVGTAPSAGRQRLSTPTGPEPGVPAAARAAATAGGAHAAAAPLHPATGSGEGDGDGDADAGGEGGGSDGNGGDGGGSGGMGVWRWIRGWYSVVFSRFSWWLLRLLFGHHGSSDPDAWSVAIAAFVLLFLCMLCGLLAALPAWLCGWLGSPVKGWTRLLGV